MYRCDNAKATLIKQAASQLISLGLSDLGYTYVNVDDCWQNETRDSSGNLAADSDRFPDGMAALAADLHAQGLRLGLYGSAGTLTCEERPGTWGYEAADAALIAGWEVDYWKHDNCYTPCDDGVVETCQNPSGNTSTWFTTMRDALLDQEYPILFSMCQWGRDEVWTWGADVGNSWRMSGDVSNAWAPVKEIAETAAALAQYSAPGGFNDLDMLVSSILGSHGMESWPLMLTAQCNADRWQWRSQRATGADALWPMGPGKIPSDPWHRPLPDL